MDSISTFFENFTSRLNGTLIAWYLYVLFCIVILTRCRLVTKILCWFPLLLTICYIVFSNGISRDFERTNFLHNFNAGEDLSKAAPAETMQALKLALEKYDVVMFDARETSDNVVVVAKDDVKNRTAEKIDLPLLKDMMDICRAKEAKMVIRVHDTSKEILKEIGSYVKQHDLHSRVVITSSNPVVPFMLKRKDSQFLSGLSYERFGMSEHFKKYHKGKLLYRYLGEFLDTVMFYAMHSFVLPEFIGADLLFVDKKDIDLRFIELAKKRKMKIIAVNADKKEDQQWLKKVAMIPYFTSSN